MPTAVQETIHVLELIVQGVPIGTNLGLLHMLWAMLSGSFLSSRGAIFSALQESGFDKGQVRRSWRALRSGSWGIERLVEAWREHVQSEGKWEEHSYEGYRPLPVDWTAFWRPRLKGWAGKMFNGVVNRAIPGVGFGIVVNVGEIDGQRLPLLRWVVRIEGDDMSESALKKATLAWVAENQKKDEVSILDAGVGIKQCHAFGIKGFVLRMAQNCTGRRNFLPPDKGGRPSQYGEKVRPLARTYKDNVIPATPPDVVEQFDWEGRVIEVQGWKDLVRSDCKVDADNDTFTIWVFVDPLYQTPLVLATDMDLLPESVFAFYLDRWPVEQVPLAAKQMIGLHRQFVFTPESVRRLPELALLAGNVLSYLAAVLPPMPTGFWDRHPKKHQDGSAGSWHRPIFSLFTKNMAEFAKRTLSPSTYRRALRAIAVKNGIPEPFSPPFSIPLVSLQPAIA